MWHLPTNQTIQAIGIGNDIVEVSRIQQAIEKQGQAFLDKVYTPLEQSYCLAKGVKQYESFASCFAAKEAIAKALGCGIGEVLRFHDMEISHDNLGKPLVDFSERFKANYSTQIHAEVALSHTQALAIANVLILRVS